MYKSKASAERAYKGYIGSKYAEDFDRWGMPIEEASRSPWTIEKVWDHTTWQDNYYDLYPGYSKPEDKSQECYWDTKEKAISGAQDLIDFFSFSNPANVYRVVHAESEEDIDTESPGSHWTITADDAIRIAGESLSLSKPWFVLHGKVKLRDIDWNTTLDQQFNNPDEYEVYIPHDERVKVVEIKKIGKNESTDPKYDASVKGAFDMLTKQKAWIPEGSRGFKGFDDPWKDMSPEDRKEANHLFALAMKAFPSSPRQIELREKLNAILKKYGIGKKKAQIPESDFDMVDKFGLPIEDAKKPVSKKSQVVGNLKVPAGILADVSGGLENVSSWKAKVVLGNSVGKNDPEVGDMGDVGYVMLNPKTKEIVPIARSDEHHTGWDLLRHYKSKGIVKDIKGFYPIFSRGHTYIWGEVEEAIPAFKLWMQNGGPDLAAETYSRSSGEKSLAAHLSTWVSVKHGEEFKEGVIPPVGKKIIKDLEAAALETAKVLKGKGTEEKVYQYARDIAHTLISFHLYSQLPKNAEKKIDELEAKGDFQGIQDLLLGMNGIKNTLHQWIREFQDEKNRSGYDFDQFERFFGDPKLALKEFDRLGQI